jgi:hypothetical protein
VKSLEALVFILTFFLWADIENKSIYIKVKKDIYKTLLKNVRPCGQKVVQTLATQGIELSICPPKQSAQRQGSDQIPPNG